MLVLDAIAVAAILLATITDLLEHKIYNLLTFPLLLLGIVAWPLLEPSQWWQGIGGALVVGVPFFVLYAIKALKAGDVKLVMAIGALLGVRLGAVAGLLSVMVWAPIGFAVLAWNGRLGEMRRMLNKDFKPLLVPYGAAIALGTLITLAKFR